MPATRGQAFSSKLRPKTPGPTTNTTTTTNTKSTRTKPQTNEESSYLKESQVQKMSSQEYEKRADEVMEAIRTGKFVYDLSGAAR